MVATHPMEDPVASDAKLGDTSNVLILTATLGAIWGSVLTIAVHFFVLLFTLGT
jgi:hypothetical protein